MKTVRNISVILSIFILSFIFSFAAKALTQTRSPGAYTNNGGDASFGVGNLSASDDARNCVNLDNGDEAKGYFTNFGFTIPIGAVVTDISVVMEGVWGANGQRDEFKVKIRNNSTDDNSILDNKNYFSNAEATGTISSAVAGGKIFNLDVNPKWAYGEINGNNFGLEIESIESKSNGGSFCFDYIAITVTYDAPCNPCYSIANGNFGTASTWSETSGGAAQTTVPANDGTIEYIIEGNYKVTVNGNYNVKNITVGNGTGTGELEWSGANSITFYDAAGIVVNANGTIDRNTNDDGQLIFDQASLSYTLINDGTFDIGDIQIGDNETVTASGGANITINDELKANGDDATFTNNNTATIFINDDIHANNKRFVITNNGTIDIASQIKSCQAGEVTFTQGANAVLILSGTGTPIDTDMSLVAAANGNFVKYDAAGDQDIHTPTDNYFHLNVETSGVKESQANLDINGNLTISGTAILDVATPANDISLAGNWINSSSGGFTEGTRTVTFDGVGAQAITCSSIGTETYHNLSVNKSGGGVITMNNHVSLTNTGILNFNGTNGYIALNSNNLTIPAWTAGDITGYDSDEFIIVDQVGYIKYTGITNGQTINIPMGLATGTANYALADLIMTDAGTGTFDANLCDQVEKGGGICTAAVDSVNNLVGYTWNLVSTSTNAIVTLSWDSSKELPGFDRTLSHIVHFNGTKWDSLSARGPATLVAGSLYARSATTNGFSPYAVQDGVDRPLPIELTSFTGKIENSQTILSWVTATETNNNYFVLEKSDDGINFTETARIGGAGNSQAEKTYEYSDNESTSNVVYYRLTQVDYDGKSTSFPIIALNGNGNKTSSSLDAILYPNPVDKGGVVKVKFNEQLSPSNILIILVDVLGNQQYIKADFVCCDTYRINTENLSTGVYYVVASQNDLLLSNKLIVN